MDFAELLERRWSPREYTDKEVDSDTLEEVFGAAHWAQSSFNEQPWRFVVATKRDGAVRDRFEGFLVEGNAFAKDAWLLGVAFSKRKFTRNQKPNRVADHDVGAATQVLALKAFDLGLNTRFMAGFDVDKTRELAPEDFEPIAMFAIGHATDAALRGGPGDRGRNSLSTYVYGGDWGKAYEF